MPSFYPENNTVLSGDKSLRTLHKIADLTAVGGGGGGGVGTMWRYWEAANVSNAAPADQSKAVERRFRNGDPPVVWDPVSLSWK